MGTISRACSFLLLVAFALTARTIDITYSLPAEGRVSLAVYDAQGRQVRTLRNAEPQKAGKYTVVWDGLDRNGVPAPAGTYTWKLLRTQGLTAEYLMNIGTSTREHWPGNHGGPCGSLVLGDTLIMTAGNSESPVTTIKMKLADGARLADWNKLSGWNAITDLAFDDTPITIPESKFPAGQLYMPIPVEGRVHVVNPDTGGTATNDYYRKKYKDPVFYAPIMRLDFTDGKAPAREGWTAAPPVKYSPERGFGWEDTEGISGFAAEGDGDVTGQFVRPVGAQDKRVRTFLVDMPIGDWFNYHVTFYLGHPVQAFNKLTIYGGLSYSQPRAQGTVALKAGEETAVSYDIMPLPGKQLRLGFGPSDVEFNGCAIRAIEISVGGSRVDAYKGKLVLGFPLANVVQQLTPDAHNVVKSWPVADFRDVALLADGRTLALSGDKAVLVEENCAPVITGLTDPHLLSVDRTTGEIFIAEWGDSQQIKRYSADYKLLATYGRKGGRRQGLYEAQDFLSVSSLAPDGAGGFVITEAESAPRRTAHFGKDGKLIREWYGGQLWATKAAADPQNEDRLWISSHWGWLMEVEVDWARRSWRPRACYNYGSLARGLTPQDGGANTFFEVRYLNGQKYLAATAAPQLLRVDEEQRTLTPVMTSALNITHYWSAQPPFMQALLGSPRSNWHSYLWNDRNGNGDPEGAEVTFSEWSNWGPRWYCDEQLRFFGIFAPARRVTDPQEAYALVMLAPDAPAGARPSYAGYDARVTYQLPADAGLHGAAGWLDGPTHLWRSPAEDTYLIMVGDGDGFTGAGTNVAGHASYWPANGSAAADFAKWDKDGKMLWKVAAKAASVDEQLRAQLHDPIKILGEVKGCVGVGDRIVQPAEFWTTDGLYVGGIFDHRANDGLPAAFYAWWRGNRAEWRDPNNESPLEYDMYTGGTLLQRKNGEVYYLGDGYNNLPTYRITGWDNFARQQGTVKVAQRVTALAMNGKGLTGIYFTDEPNLLGSNIMPRVVNPQIWFGDPKSKCKWPDDLPNFTQAIWTGMLEPRFTEDYYLHLYVGKDKAGMPELAKVYLDGPLVIDTNENPQKGQTRFRSKPISLIAGKRVAIEVKYWKRGDANIHLCWESVSQPIAHIPAECLYPAE